MAPNIIVPSAKPLTEMPVPPRTLRSIASPFSAADFCSSGQRLGDDHRVRICPSELGLTSRGRPRTAASAHVICPDSWLYRRLTALPYGRPQHPFGLVGPCPMNADAPRREREM